VDVLEMALRMASEPQDGGTYSYYVINEFRPMRLWASSLVCSGVEKRDLIYFLARCRKRLLRQDRSVLCLVIGFC